MEKVTGNLEYLNIKSVKNLNKLWMIKLNKYFSNAHSALE